MSADLPYLRSKYGSFDSEVYDLLCCAEGISLSKEQASALNSKLEIHPEDLKSRLILLGYYFKFQNNRVKGAERQKHIMWMLRNRPREYICSTDRVSWTGNIRKYYSETKALWLELIKANPKDAVILGNAGCFFIIAAPCLARQYLKRSLKLDPANKHFQRALETVEEILAKYN